MNEEQLAAIRSKIQERGCVILEGHGDFLTGEIAQHLAKDIHNTTGYETGCVVDGDHYQIIVSQGGLSEDA